METDLVNASVDNGTSSTWKYLFIDLADPYTKDWFMVGSLGKLFLILLGYVYFCTKLGPRIMKNREPFKLNRTIQLYNIIQILANAWVVHEGLKSGWGTTYSYRCEPVDYSDSESGMRMRRVVWFYYMIKLTDLLDTVFFVLRKKYNQVTYLHIYHHTLMPVVGFMAVTFVPGGHGTLIGIINGFIHMILYLYYYLAALGPEVQKYLWWKKYVTKLQLIQFVIIGVHNAQALPRDCAYPKIFNFLMAVQCGYFMYLFGSFYVRAYIEKKPQKTVIKDELKEKIEDNRNTPIANETISNGSGTKENGLNGAANALDNKGKLKYN